MYEVDFNQAENHYELAELVRMFLPPSQYRIVKAEDGGGSGGEACVRLRIPDNIRNKNEGKRWLYESLKAETGAAPDWGILTGVRPVKLAGDYMRAGHSLSETREWLVGYCCLTEEKTALLLDILKVQMETGWRERTDSRAVGLYVGIPFCPTRCVYCSFTSNQAAQEGIDAYLEALHREIAFAGEQMDFRGWYPESVYIGGGTPTALSADELDRLLEDIRASFDMKRCLEFTVEAGRPDTITAEKLEVLRGHGVERSCINPQSMKAKTLELIGRRHSPEDVLSAFRLAKEAGISVLNMDMIAGLPEETPEDFLESLRQVMALRPENITVHTLAVKRASKLREIDSDYCYHQGGRVRTMLEQGQKLLTGAGYRPYYLYRQKQMAGNFENVGYALPGTESVYNIRIMEENQTILALGAGGISKVWYPEENRLERIPNVSNYEIYIQRLDEMLERKRHGIFTR